MENKVGSVVVGRRYECYNRKSREEFSKEISKSGR